jgi:surface polysaccharide O-acyltransferase-like enzyme
MVVTYHAINEPYDPAAINTAQYSAMYSSHTVYFSVVLMGVPLFFMLSGALLLQPSKVNEPIGVFFKKRVNRIAIAFVFWSIIYLLWSFFVDKTAMTPQSAVQSLLGSGAYYQFWFIYAMIGLYLLTPILRVVSANSNQKILLYIVVLWFLSVAAVPFLHLLTGLVVNGDLLVIGGSIGYFVLGEYIMRGVSLKTKTVRALLIGSVACTIIGIYLVTGPFSALNQWYFFNYISSFNIIFASFAVFVLLSRHSPDWPGSNHPKLSRFIQAISANTLAIFFLHPIVLETLYRGYLGVRISQFTFISPFVEIPVLGAVALLVTLSLVLVMKKVPVLKILIG